MRRADFQELHVGPGDFTVQVRVGCGLPLFVRLNDRAHAVELIF